MCVSAAASVLAELVPGTIFLQKHFIFLLNVWRQCCVVPKCACLFVLQVGKLCFGDVFKVKIFIAVFVALQQLDFIIKERRCAAACWARQRRPACGTLCMTMLRGTGLLHRLWPREQG